MSLDDQFINNNRVSAGIMLRAIATLLDAIFILLPAKIFFGSSLSFFDPDLNSWLTTLMFWWLYNALMESSDRRGTIGKIITGISVIQVNGDALSFGASNVRFFVKTLSILTVGIGFAMAFFNPNKQTLHDTIAKTLVVKVQ